MAPLPAPALPEPVPALPEPEAPPMYVAEQPMMFGTESAAAEPQAFDSEQPLMFASGGGEAPPAEGYSYEAAPPQEGEPVPVGEGEYQEQAPQQ